MLRMNYKLFQTGGSDWEPLLQEAAAFAGRLGPDLVVNITTHENRFTWKPTVLVTVWYWAEAPD